MSEKNSKISNHDTNTHKLDFGLSTQSHNCSLSRVKLQQEVEKLNKTNKQKVKSILTYLAKRIEFNKRLFNETDILKMKQMFEEYEVWSDNSAEFNKQDRGTFKLVREEHRVYFGQIKNHKKSGKGMSAYQDGRMYEGSYFQNQKHGFGIQSYPNGNVYNGNFEHNKKHGKGEMYWFSLKGTDVDEYYVGDWWGGLPFGEGKHQRSNGDFYEGKFKNGLKHGIGQQSFANGNFYRGEYVNGLAEGNGEFLWANGDYYIGEFKQGLKSGMGKWRNKDNTEWYQGQYLFDLKCGNGVLYDPQGRTYRGSFMNDNYHGLGQIKQGQQNIYRGFWENGKPITDSKTPRSIQRNNPQHQSSYRLPKHKSMMKLNRSNSKILNQSITKSYKSRNYQSASRRVGTEGSVPITARKQLGVLKRPKSLMKLNLKSNHNTVKRMETECQQNLCGRKFGHKGCIPFFPWEVRTSKVLDKIGRRKLTEM